MSIFFQYWFNLSILPYLSYDSYKSWLVVNKFTYNTMKKIKEKQKIKDIYEEFELYLLKKGGVLYGGCIRDRYLNQCPVDIDYILPVNCVDVFIKLIFVELFHNSILSIDFNFNDTARHKLRQIFNKIYNYNKRNPQNMIDIMAIIKKTISSEIGLDITNVKDCKYIHEEWDIMFTIRVFYCGNIINMDTKFTCEKQKFDFFCNAMFQKMSNGKILTYITNSKELSIDVNKCIQDCIDKKAIKYGEKIKTYQPGTQFMVDRHFSHCNKLHLDVDSHMLERIKKMINKGFVIDDIDPLISSNDIVGVEQCYIHCDTKKIRCFNCFQYFFAKRDEQIENCFRNICGECKQKHMIKCKKCKINVHNKQFMECRKCNMLKFKKCSTCSGMFCRINFTVCYKCYVDDKIKTNNTMIIMDQLPGHILSDDSSDEQEYPEHSIFEYYDDDYDMM